MSFSFTYEEIADLANFYLLEDKTTDKMELQLEPVESGFRINIIKFKVSFITIKSKIDIRFKEFDGNTLTVSLHFKNLFFELVKKVVFVVVLNLLKNKLADPERDIDISEHIHFSTSEIDVEINQIMNLMEVPLYLDSIHDYRKLLEIRFSVQKNKNVLRKEPKQIAANMNDNIQ